MALLSANKTSMTRTSRSRTRWFSLAMSSFKLACFLHLAIGWTSANLVMNLPDGIENILGFVPRSSFQCERDGYFGDIDNDCKLFHLCQRNVNPISGKTEWRHWTYACGNQTMFNQLTLTCAFVDEAIPCRHANQFQYLNEVIHKPAEPFLTDADVTSGISYYSNRIMSDGARARAFQDSQLLAQIGGQSQASAPNQLESLAESPRFQNELTETTNNFQTLERFSASNLNSQFSSSQPQQDDSVVRSGPQASEPQRQQVNQSPAQQQTNQPQQRQDLIENHSFQFQHQPQQFDNQQPQQPQQPQFQPPPTNLQEQFAAVQQVQPQTSNANNAPNLFEFSIATNHQNFGAPTQLTFNQASQQHQQFFVPPQPQQQQQQQQPQESNQVDLRTQFGPRTPTFDFNNQPTPTTTTTAATTTAAAAATAATTTEAQTTSLPLVSSTLAPSFSSTQRLQLVQPTQSTASGQLTSSTPSTLATPPEQTQAATTEQATTTTTTTTTAATITARRSTNTNRSQQAARRLVAEERTTNNVANFQSARLSSLNRRMAAADTPLVMRRQPNSSSGNLSARQQQQQPRAIVGVTTNAPSSSTSTTAASTTTPTTTTSRQHQQASDKLPFQLHSSALAGGDFWRRSNFDVQLIAPKFESLLLRRRV